MAEGQIYFRRLSAPAEKTLIKLKEQEQGQEQNQDQVQRRVKKNVGVALHGLKVSTLWAKPWAKEKRFVSHLVIVVSA